MTQSLRRRAVRLADHVTSIQIEDAFWDYLKAAARRAGGSLSALLIRIRTTVPDGANFTSALRVWCLEQANQTLAAAQFRIRQFEAGGGAEIAQIVAALPLPAVLLDADQRTVAHNDAFVNWLRLAPGHLDTQPEFLVFVPRGARPTFQAMCRRARTGDGRAAGGTMNIVAAGRLRIVRATVIGLRTVADGEAAGRSGALVLFEASVPAQGVPLLNP